MTTQNTNQASTQDRLNSFFHRALANRTPLQPKQSRIFLEALVLQPDPPQTLEKVWNNEQRRALFRDALFSHAQADFLDNEVTAVLRYLQDPHLRSIQAGEFLRQILQYIVDPPFLWTALVEEMRKGTLGDNAISAFAWLLLELLHFKEGKARTLAREAGDQVILQRLSEAEMREVTTNFRKIQCLISSSSDNVVDGVIDDSPGWRHDNDHKDFRDIAILPTAEELRSTERPFLRRAAEIAEEAHESRFLTHIDNQFRLLRDDMMRDLREELRRLRGDKPKGQRSLLINGLTVEGLKTSLNQRWSLRLLCQNGLPGLPKKAKLDFLKNNSNRFLRHESLCCILVKNKPIAFAYIDRDEDLLACNHPILCIRFDDGPMVKDVLAEMKRAENLSVLQLNTPVFAYAPILRQLQNIRWIALGEEIIASETAKLMTGITAGNQNVLGFLQGCEPQDLSTCLELPKSTILDSSQKKCFEAALSQQISLIQGPPGTGKSLIGALIAKAMYLHTSLRILVLCYKNHMLDQFLEDLIAARIPQSSMVRIGALSKTSHAVQSLNLTKQLQTYRASGVDYRQIDEKKEMARELTDKISEEFQKYNERKLSIQDLKKEADLDLDHPQFCGAFDLPAEEDGMQKVGRKGKAIDEFYLFTRWCKGQDAGIFPEVAAKYSQVWKMPSEDRQATYTRWKDTMLSERASALANAAMSRDKILAEIAMLRNEKTRQLLKSKRIIGCTTTGAAKYVRDIQAVSPGIVLVEEAGEILESHVLTALGPETQQLVLIGDHQQLRPKVHYDLSVSKGEGYDLDVSLFERLVLKGYPHETLSEQHRMRPEISALVQNLTYKSLRNAPSTQNRPHIRGLQADVVFIDHKHLEDDAPEVRDTRDVVTGCSKRNSFELEMTLKIVKYLGQQGYGTADIVVLTPYLAQLRLLMDALAKDNDPVLNDLDSHDLVRAGIMPATLANSHKKKLKLSSIDNYQGEQSDIVVISLTRSNARGDIGFLVSPERLNVLLSRARDGMFIIGNSETFLRSKKGKGLWERFFDTIAKNHMFFDGLPVQCAQHTDRKQTLRTPNDFEKFCPDGGCQQPCNTLLPCGKHSCPQKCHQLSDHSRIKCMVNVNDKCPNGHTLSWPCFKSGPQPCPICEHLKANQERLQQASRQSQVESDKQALQVQLIEDEIRAITQQRNRKSQAKQMAALLEQKRADLQQAKRLAAQQDEISNAKSKNESKQGNQTNSKKTQSSESSSPITNMRPKLDAEIEWERLKQEEGASNGAIDDLMSLRGLEKVKEKFLTIYARVSTGNRQGLSFQHERFGVALLGNPGTGKTTVARMYARFLSTIGVIPGSHFEETTGSRLANDGVNGAQRLLDKIQQAGGGVLFIDEAYQLASGHSSGGAAVLDFILAEIENLTGQVVFILAGYNKQMEKFFQHNQGFPSRIPITLEFEDYTDAELLAMLEQKIHKKYNGNMKVQDGYQGLYSRIAVRRLARNRGQEGFGNARALENMLVEVSERQVERLSRERRAGLNPNDFVLTKDDIIGPEPTAALKQSQALHELQEMIGLGKVKDSVKALLDRLSTNYQRELQEKPTIEVSLNRVFLGSPGTGKTSVAKLYGKILKEIGCLTNGEVMLKNPSDFVGSVLGESEKNTKAILESAKGKVLIIDEAYMLHSSSDSGLNHSDPFKTAVVDTIVAEVQSTPGDDRCVLLLGYKEQLEQMFKASNPGLARRFPLAEAFDFEDFNDNELRQILDLKLQKQDLHATEEAKQVAMDVLNKARQGVNFGNGGEVENVISRAKDNYQTRLQHLEPSERPVDVVFSPGDFDREYARLKNASSNCKELFRDVVGCEDIVEKLEGFTRTVGNMIARNIDPKTVIPFNFIFKGPPGTGKTTTARKMGQVFCNMNLLASSEVVECSATELIGQYVGQTGPKTTNQLTRALGKVLFIDEAYRLGEGHFATEAINELVDNLTKPTFHNKLVVILAGYEDAMNSLIRINQGLASRFAEEVLFKNMTPEQCLQLLCTELLQKQVHMHIDGSEDILRPMIYHLFAELSKLKSWGNGRDVGTLAKKIAAEVFRDSDASADRFAIEYCDIVRHLTKLLDSATSREAAQPEPFGSLLQAKTPPLRTQEPPPPYRITQNTSVATSAEFDQDLSDQSPAADSAADAEEPVVVVRDVGVTDAIWNELQEARKMQEDLRKDLEQTIQRTTQEASEAAEREAELQKQVETWSGKHTPAQPENEEDPRIDEAKRAHEEARIRRIRALRAKEEAERKKKLEAEAQRKLRAMGVCPFGYRWIKQEEGYRCAGGSHFVSNEQIGQ